MSQFITTKKCPLTYRSILVNRVILLYIQDGKPFLPLKRANNSGLLAKCPAKEVPIYYRYYLCLGLGFLGQKSAVESLEQR